MRIALHTYAVEYREALVEVLESEGAQVVRRNEHLGGATGTSIFGLIDIASWLDAHPWFLQNVISNVASAPLIAFGTYLATVAAKKLGPNADPPPVNLLADIELYGMFARAYLSAKVETPIQETAVLQPTVLGCTADNAAPYFPQFTGGGGNPWIIFVCSTTTKYYAVTLDSQGALLRIADLGDKPYWMLPDHKNRK